tara:strand:- start:81665 stop:82633 length:969 start_codon:yes stop_codon:yes gene_type:complete
MLSEFELIKRYFLRSNHALSRAALGIGDDCALLNHIDGMQTAISTDMLVEGRHFFAGSDPYQLGHKSLAVNLSDLAAMGAQPQAFTLAFSLPAAEENWLAEFSKGLFALADLHECELIGGDTTKGPLNICITVFGQTPTGQALRRSTAKAGDDIWVSGTLGDARLALDALNKKIVLDDDQLTCAASRLHMPQPRVALGLALRGVAHAALDVSDGLIGDLGHILQGSKVGATLYIDRLPLGPILQQQTKDVQRRLALSGGDDYELCFTASSNRREEVLGAALAANTQVTRIGSIETQSGLRLIDQDDAPYTFDSHSFDHFTNT